MNFLSAREKQIYTNYVNNYAIADGYLKATQNVENVENALREWKSAKSHHLFKIFGDSLILKKEVTYKKNVDVMVEEFYNKYFYTNEHIRQFFKKLIEVVRSIEADDWGEINDIASIKKLLNNRWEGSSMSIPLPDGKSFKINANTKVARILTKISKAYNIDYLNEVLDARSVILTDRKINDVMYLSIHPLDYITMSDNAEGWDSCMNWRDEGCYRGGTMEMLNSPYVVVGYMKSDEEFEDWNSKIWRELYIVDKDIICNIRAYPFRNTYLSQFNLEWLKELAENAEFGSYRDEILHFNSSYNRVESKNSEFFWNGKHEISLITGVMYNDFGRDVNYCFWTKDETVKTVDLCYSGKRTCAICGDFFAGDEKNVVCDSCGYRNTFSCYCCEEEYPREELYEVDGVLVCDYCYGNETVSCLDDEESHLMENCYEIIVDINGSDYHVCLSNKNNLVFYLINKDADLRRTYYRASEFNAQFFKDLVDKLGYYINEVI